MGQMILSTRAIAAPIGAGCTVVPKASELNSTAYDITGEAQLNRDCVYEADEIDLILLSDRRRIGKYKDTDLDLGYQILMLLVVKWDVNDRTAASVGLGRINQNVWWDASPTSREV
jgi:hypothetical protein